MKLTINLSDKCYVLTHETNGSKEVLTLGNYPQPRKLEALPLNEINGYFATMDKSVQDSLFTLYCQAVDIITSEFYTFEIQGKIATVFANIMNHYYNLDCVANYVETLNIEYPSTVLEDYNEADSRKPRERTYIKSEYFGLACVALVCHGMAPLWTLLGGSLLSSDRDDVLARDSTILSTLCKTDFIKDEKWVGRLYTMIVYLVENLDDKLKLAVKVDGSGSDGLPPFLLATILINKLSTCSIVSAENKNIIVAAHNSVDSEIKKYAASRGRILERSEKRMSDDEDNKLGFFEAYTTRSKVSDDIYIVNQLYCENYRQLKSVLDDSIPYNLVKMCLTSLQRNGNKCINPIHTTLCQWCLAHATQIDKETNARRRILMIRALECIERDGILGAMAVTQAALITWGFESIAKYISASPKIKQDEDLLISNTPNLIEISSSSEIKDMLKVTHPYMRPQGIKSAAALNMATESINEFVLSLLQLEKFDWYVECSDDVARALKTKQGLIETDIYIKHQLAHLVAFIAR